MDIKKVAWFGVSTIILLGLIYFADISKFIDALSSADPLPLIPAFVFGFSVFFVFANTWREFLTKMGAETSLSEAFRLFMSGQFMNSVTPLGQFGGEPFMAYVINQNTDLSYEEAFSTVLSGDIINGVPTFTFLIGGGVYLALFSSLTDIVAQTLYAAVIILAVGGPIAYLLWFKTGAIEGFLVSILSKISDKLGRGDKLVSTIESRLDEVEKAFESIGENPYHLLKTALIAHLSFIFQVFCLYLILFAFGFTPDFSPLYFIIVIAGLANFAPTPGGSGAYEATMTFLLTQFLPSVSNEFAVATAIIFRLTTYWPGILVGYLALLSLENSGET